MVLVSEVSSKTKPFSHLASCVIVVYGSVCSGFSGCLLSCTCVQSEVQTYHCVQLAKPKDNWSFHLMKTAYFVTRDNQSLLTEIVF